MHTDFIPFNLEKLYGEEQRAKTRTFREFMEKRRSVRTFSSEPIPADIIGDVIMTASSAPSGAHKQPWHFCAISDPVLKNRIRHEAEKEEYLSYTKRMSEEWKEDLKKLQTNWEKPCLEEAPWLIAVFMEPYEFLAGKKKRNYYVKESVGLATGFLLAALWNAGLVSLTYTPSPMDFLSDILDRPRNQKPYLLIPVGYPADGTKVPDLIRKPKEKVLTFYT